MGPRSGDRGNPTDHAIPAVAYNVLQWGRDLVIAEIGMHVAAPQNAFLLQWGRDLVIAEIRGGSDQGETRLRASMGPRSGDRGNISSSYRHIGDSPASMGPRSGDRGNSYGHPQILSDFRLQWGRDLVIAEMWRKAAVILGSQCVSSMGPRSGDRGNSAKSALKKSHPELQWGRDLVIAEITPMIAVSTATTEGFNGAAIW